MFSLRPVLESLALLVSASVVFAQQQVDDNTDDSSALLMTNYNALREEGQGFYLSEHTALFESPESVPIPVVLLYWWCDLDFSLDDADSINYGYVGRGVQYFLGSSLDDVVAQGGQIPSTKKMQAMSISAVMVPTLGIFEGQIHKTDDDLLFRFWDDGKSTLPFLGSEGHDQGDTSPQADTSAFSMRGKLTKITTEAAAEVMGMTVADMKPATCSKEYGVAWNTNNTPDPIATSVTALEEKVAQQQADIAQQQADINELRSLIANGNGSGDDGDPTSSSSSSFMAWYKHDTTDIVVKSIMTVAIIIGLVAVDFI